MKIITALKTQESIRISYGNKWMYWDGTWVVREHKHGKHSTDVLIDTDNEELAIKILLKD